MKLLMWHCKTYDVKLTGISNRPEGIKPEKQRFESEHMKQCIVSMITIEKEDNNLTAKEAAKEIEEFAKDTKSSDIVIMPFVHLSNDIADSSKTLKITNEVHNKLREKFNILKSHFGYHKELLLHTFGHKTNVRFREF